MIAQVVVDIAHTALKDTYDYSVPEGLDVQLGSRVSVPFGRKNVVGVVFSFSDTSSVPASKLKSIGQVLDPFPVMREDDRALAAYLADTYRLPLAKAVQKILPAKLRENRPLGRKIVIVETALSGSALSAAFDSLRKKDGSVRYPKQMEILTRLQNSAAGIAASELPSSSVKSLLRKGFVRSRCDYVLDIPEPALEPVHASSELSLEPQQKNAIDAIFGSDNKRILLHGVTGSGKTEVYIELVRRVLNEGKSAIIMVPEIALTPQIHEYLRSRLEVPIALFHSRMTETERLEQWNYVRTGAARVVLGARSAVLAPVENLGAIIIDEEHETSYKASEYPPFTAKELAHFRAERNGAYLVLGSATPSMESYQSALDGELKLVPMPERLFDKGLPPVEIVDMRAEVRSGNPGIISDSLDHAIRQALSQNEQIMILLNRRGYTSFLMCTTCGEALGCSMCDVSMTYHKSEGMLKCHYCGAHAPVPERCPNCGGRHLRRVGIGTQKLEEYLHSQYPDAQILRMDADTMSGRTAHKDAYESFRDGKADILIGTQMIAKGFDFERVSVAAVIAADGMLHQPDFRSAERAFAQITQLAGRAGRHGTGGRVFLQTYNPDHYAIRHAAQHDYESFFREESAYRQGLDLPPYGQYILIRFSSSDDENAKQATRDFLGKLSVALAPYKDGIKKARASESPVQRIAGEYRYQILIHMKEKNNDVENILYDLLRDSEYSHVLVGIDVSPIDMH